MQTVIVAMAQGYLLLAGLQLLLWLVQLRTRDASTADIGWSAGMMLFVGWLAAELDGYWLREVMIVAMISIWSVRLSSYLIARVVQDSREDSRYARLRKYWGDGAELNFIVVYQCQPLFNIILSVPLVIALSNTAAGISPLEILGVGIWLVGLVGEAAADQQLNRFRSDPANKGKICSSGLWKYSRHPNFFFEWTMWLAYAVFAMASPYGIYGWIAPAFMLFLLMKVTGIPVMEKHALRHKGQAFRAYMRDTSFFVPMPPAWWQRLRQGSSDVRKANVSTKSSG
ncbi:MAG: DUF1295 domain-containing protein [Candidatus Omnitrophica bacterium]|nr:DUF1295 domain-containing protein [Candidatus Omnitrophota bacterium]MCB9720409.1 DUF1295 domain-containing protein [Candidatus Omnitrophota bacterium]